MRYFFSYFSSAFYQLGIVFVTFVDLFWGVPPYFKICSLYLIDFLDFRLKLERAFCVSRWTSNRYFGFLSLLSSSRLCCTSCIICPSIFIVGFVEIPRYPSGISNSMMIMNDVVKAKLTLHLLEHLIGVPCLNSFGLLRLDLEINEGRRRRHVCFNILVSRGWLEFFFLLYSYDLRYWLFHILFILNE